MIYNVKYVDYGDYLHIEHFDRPIIRKDVTEDEKKIVEEFQTEQIKNDLQFPCELVQDEKHKEHCLQVSCNRSKNNMFQIARSNDWDIFATFTFNREDTDASDYNLVSKRMTDYMKGLKSKNPDLKYLVVPEYHKDKTNFHFHALMSNVIDMNLKLSDKLDSLGSPVYNIKSWKWGFSSAVYIQDQSRVKNYIGKYITKDLMNKLKYKKRYYCSQNVSVCKEVTDYLTLEDIYDLYGDNISFVKTITVNGVNRIHYFEIKKDIDE